MRRVLLLLLFFTHVATAQLRPSQRFLKQFGAAEGLPQPFIYALAQDRAGYLWIGTAEGLVRFDGTEFVTFTTKEGLAENFVTKLYVHPRTGQPWVGHYQGGVSRWTGRRFQRLTPAEAATAPLRPHTGILPPDTAFREYGKSPSTIVEPPGFEPSFNLQHLLPSGTVVQCVLPDREHNLWIGTAGQGLWRWSDRQVTFFPASSPELTSLGSNAAGLGGLSDGYFAILGRGAKAGSAVRRLTERLPYAPTVLLPSFTQRAERVFKKRLRKPAPFTIWAGTTGHGLWQVEEQVAQNKLAHPRLVRRVPANLAVTALTQHPNGDLWVGTALDGVYRLPADSTRPAQHFTTANGLLHNTIYALTADTTGAVWIGTHDTGLAVWRNGRFYYHRFAEGGIDVSALLTDDAGRVWIGTEGRGVLCYTNGRFQTYSTPQGLASPYCYALLPVRWGTSYHGGYNNDPRRERIVVVHRNAVSFADSGGRFAPATLPDNPLVRDLLPQAAAAWDDYCLWLKTRTGLLRLRTDEPDLLPTAAAPQPALLLSEVDGAARPPHQLGELSATRHRVSFRFRGVSLLPGRAGMQYQYRLRGYQEEWSTPTIVGEAQFPRLDAGQYIFEVRARLGEHGPWSEPVATSFSIATPFWRTGWFAALGLLTAGAGVWAVVRGRELTLRRQKLQLETTVRERTAELRQQKAEIEQINADLRVARDAAEASRRAKAQFLANMSHEIRTPMNAVIGLTHLLRNTPVSSEQGEYLEAIQSSSQNLLVIINDILDSSKMEAGKLTLEQAPFRLPELVERVSRLFAFATEAKGLRLRTEVAPEVPAAIFGDSVRLNQVLVNLVGNAVKFTTRGEIGLRVAVVPDAELPRLRFAVQDTGIGIAASKLEAIFEDFSQANASTTRQFGGTGLGLSIARNLVHLHGGRMWVESTEGQGSTFWFEIPCLPADEASVRPETAAFLAPFEPALQVLVAEDNDLNQLVARKTLEAWNVRVTIAANGRLAVEAAQQQPFDAVLLDVQMPEMDGYEAARQLRLLFPDSRRLPLIGLTASALPEDRALALQAGMNDTLAKPFDPAVLYARLAYFTGRTPAPQPPAAPSPPEVAPTPASPGPLPPQPDWSLLEELASGNESFVQQIVRTFLTQAPLLAAQLLSATSGAELAAVAHKLKGQVAYFGVEPLTQQLEQLEQEGRRGSLPAALAPQLALMQQQLTGLYPLLRLRLPHTPA
ncbi:signal transduction histidine kinase/CheY-like chemotaxis protein/HPt (histidine-containing phosphotransfer) domain-containing protein [Hymenobacter luteus]|uniref:Sensory/regulatory protein RpfC n=2 Tax=Hymenobacter TaxID=89966 RepID=A0A7W9WA51_9BACT|nr:MULTISPECIES: hybrid sensor histidine kinase/response regulator [Hymenobacter]MBB4600157.1 signal transduction histidine kinase/CheY-like chemotaxis protein/HPt (histidine-containing phosphotransfer) domain-containing protein [Hymenobacter latericoloratus]MBB6057533.1 signal transduction histidine kinase/CheY-like chemotaxis protein/HPt (histidine-containing phosphotransfer) domain-containing protein [Hymenobacter luteus]